MHASNTFQIDTGISKVFCIVEDGLSYLIENMALKCAAYSVDGAFAM